MIQPGLERIGLLLKDVSLPWKAVHVGGTNGKGSVCHMVSTLLTRRFIKCGKFTSPHLIDRWDTISINEEPVEENYFRKIEEHYKQLNERESISASSFEILTATAFTIFNEKKVQVGVVEVGMGGKLDATNILNNQAVSVINKIARDHQEFLGTSLEEIALHKAGILRPNVPYILNPYNDSTVLDTINKYAEEIGAGPRLQIDTLERREEIFSRKLWHEFAGPLQPFQRDNAILGVIAAQQAVSSLGLKFEDSKILAKLRWVKKQHHFGRQHIVAVGSIFGHPGKPVLVDGAHNPDAAIALRGFLKRPRKRLIEGKILREDRVEGESKTEGEERESIHDRYEPTTYVIAMKEDKNALGFLRTLLRPGDKVVTTTFGPVDGMPWVKPMDPTTLLQIAKISEDRITGLHIPKPGALRAVYAASLIAGPRGRIVLTGSLYFVGDFYRELRSSKIHRLWNDEERVQEREVHNQIKQEESERVQNVFGDLKNLLAKDDPESLATRELEDLAGSSNKSMTRLERLEKIKATRQSYENLPPWVRATLAGTGAPPSDEQHGSDSEHNDEPLVTMHGMKLADRIIPYSPDQNVSRNPLRMRKYIEGTEESETPFAVQDQLAKPEPEHVGLPRYIRKQVVERVDGPHFDTKRVKTET